MSVLYFSIEREQKRSYNTFMQKVLLIICAALSLLSATACRTVSGDRQESSMQRFETPFGIIAQGDSMAEVVSLLGNPHEVSTYQRREIWHYAFQEEGTLSVYFKEGVVTQVYVQ